MRCTPYSQNSAFLPVTELIGRRLGLDRSLSSDAQLDRIDNRLTELNINSSDAAPLLAELLSLPVSERYPPLTMSPIRRRARTLEILVNALKEIALQHRTLLIVEDLHWADPSTLELLQLIIKSRLRRPLLGIFTARPEFQPAWKTTGATSLIDVSRLKDAEVEAVVLGVAHGKSMPGEVLRELVQRCDGVPLFVEEVTAAVMESACWTSANSHGNLRARSPPLSFPNCRCLADGQNRSPRGGTGHRAAGGDDRSRVFLCTCPRGERA